MDSDLYGILGLGSEATPEQIRKAYKKKALQTHPDRLPPGASAADKAASEEQFRKVNNAYEVLNDPQNRRTYDHHGVWPPPEPREQPPPHRNGASRRHQSFGRPHQQPYEPFEDNFMFNSYSSPFGGRGFAYTDPFTLFDSIFNNLNQFTESPFLHHHHGDSRSHRQPPFFAETEHLFQSDDLLNSPMRGAFPRRRAHTTHMFPVIPSAPPPPTILFQRAESRTYPQNGHWTQESRVTSTVNGVTQSIWKRRDTDGNEHITRTYPDGREKYTINGVEQVQSIQGPGSRVDRYIPPQNYSGGQYGHHVVPPPTLDRIQAGGRQDYAPAQAGPPPSYSSRGYHRNHPNNSPVYQEPTGNRHRDRAQSDTKRWWRGWS